MLTPDPREHAAIATILLGEPVWEAGDVETTLLGRPDPAASATVAVYRASGAAPRPWSAVCKVLSGDRMGHPNWPSSDDAGHWYWWRREEMAYATGLLAKLAGGLRAPRFLNTFGRERGQVALWMEDVTAPPASAWTVGRYRECAHQLARAQWELIDGVPEDGWLVDGFLAGYLDRHLGAFDGAPGTPLVSAARRLMDSRAPLLRHLDAFPVTMCHNDLHAFNLFGEPGGDSIAIDWSFVGRGPLPVDAGAFATDAVLDYGAPPDQLPDLHAAVEDGFAAGMAEAGWSGDEERLRLAMRAAAALKFAWVAPVAADPDPETVARWEAHYGRDGAAIAADRAMVAEWLVDIGTAAAGRLGE